MKIPPKLVKQMAHYGDAWPRIPEEAQELIIAQEQKNYDRLHQELLRSLHEGLMRSLVKEQKNYEKGRSIQQKESQMEAVERMTLEEAANIQHRVWSHWMKYMFSLCERTDAGELVIPTEKVERWTYQLSTSYLELSEEERESDRHVVREFFPVKESQIVKHCKVVSLSCHEERNRGEEGPRDEAEHVSPRYSVTLETKAPASDYFNLTITREVCESLRLGQALVLTLKPEE